MKFTWLSKIEQQPVSEEITQVYLELSTHCNLSCTTCVRNSIIDFKPAHLSIKLFNKIFQMLKKIKTLDRIVIFGFGEALTHPDFKIILKKLRKLDCKIVLITNSFFLTEEMSNFLVDLPVDEIFVSWDDDINVNNQKIRLGSDLFLFKKNIEFFVESKIKSGRDISVGLEFVATKTNHKYIKNVIKYSEKIGINKMIISNLFPYSEEMKKEILYKVYDKPDIDFYKKNKRVSKTIDIQFASQKADRDRLCPFIEKGTLFITSKGDVSPCPELAYTHRAYYFSSMRMQNKYHIGNVGKISLDKIWNNVDFKGFRKDFLYYEFPDCSTCHNPSDCWHRNVEEKDCYDHSTPCGECLWAKNIILCP